ncbi:hypothetical protein [Leifsonia poae]|uniref:hypothetical protein n=1 Tax=Leifsonia poae TaxID=110933 RepID=UPI0022F2A4E0|nr:hypothetical protein [Leifsonia poae]
MAYLDVPPPEPFSQSAITEMWEARGRLELKKRPPTSGEAAWANLAAVSVKGFSWPELSSAVDAAVALLGHWPQYDRVVAAWGPMERGNGRILNGTTERARAALANASTKPKLPAKVARSRGEKADEKLAGLSAICILVAEKIATFEPFQSKAPLLAEQLVGLFRRVAAKSRPRSPRADPPASTWPPRMRHAYASSVRLLTEFEDSGAGDRHAPLSELWELYEAWVSERVLDGLTNRFGTPVHEVNSASWIWMAESRRIAVYLQPSIPGASGKQGFRALGAVLEGVIATSRPDILFVRESNSESVLKVIDAKKRKKTMIPDDLTVNASKYLWNIRHASASEDFAIEEVLLVSPLGGPDAAHGEGRARTFGANPSASHDLPQELLDQLLM